MNHAEASLHAASIKKNGHPDYALFISGAGQTAIAYLSGVTVTGAAFGPTVRNGWTLVATAEFNADGSPDFLLYNAATRQTGFGISITTYISAPHLAGLFQLAGACSGPERSLSETSSLQRDLTQLWPRNRKMLRLFPCLRGWDEAGVL